MNHKPFFAVATNIDIARKYPDLENLNWLPLKSISVSFKNCMQIHFDTYEKAKEFYELIKARGIIVFKNWK